MSAILDIDGYTKKYDDIRVSYEEKYGVTYDVTEEQYSLMTDAEKDRYREAVDAMNGDEEANNAITTAYTLTFVTFASGSSFRCCCSSSSLR
jgi:conjugal transfer/entry exclusion protein